MLRTPLYCCQVKHTPCAPSNLFWRYTVHPLLVTLLENGLYNGSGPGEFLLAKRQIPVNSIELLYFALSFCSEPLLSSDHHPPPNLATLRVTRTACPFIYPNLYTRCRRKQKEIIREIMFSPSGFSESQNQKNRYCFLTVKYLLIFLVSYEPSLNNVYACIIKINKWERCSIGTSAINWRFLFVSLPPVYYSNYSKIVNAPRPHSTYTVR